ncbi:hypothetical protein DTO96_102379 [Ephemeroptericola cinctiostellae]|uniref:Uncharacterized protein n=1 Tax=Ephemeroptericola cinctiostellae TaxID=2268024 RepID=A0A345DE36_9BURK|nr:hypothetical protein [Ephemeroptericola cinctiostellae]AXF86624.1 hypothetical protein DTO96_102379 [Ephemeroptericola cinctiostellae]
MIITFESLAWAVVCAFVISACICRVRSLSMMRGAHWIVLHTLLAVAAAHVQLELLFSPMGAPLSLMVIVVLSVLYLVVSLKKTRARLASMVSYFGMFCNVEALFVVMSLLFGFFAIYLALKGYK